MTPSFSLKKEQPVSKYKEEIKDNHLILSTTRNLEMDAQCKWQRGRQTDFWTIDFSGLGPETFVLRTNGINQHG